MKWRGYPLKEPTPEELRYLLHFAEKQLRWANHGCLPPLSDPLPAPILGGGSCGGGRPWLDYDRQVIAITRLTPRGNPSMVNTAGISWTVARRLVAERVQQREAAQAFAQAAENLTDLFQPRRRKTRARKR